MKDLLIVDLQDATSIGINTIARQCNIFSSISEGIDKTSIVHFLKNHSDGVVIVDYTMVDLSEEYLIVLHARYTKACFILFSDSLVTDFIKRLVYFSTCFSFILKDSSRKEIESGLKGVSLMKQFICEKVTNQIAQADSDKHEAEPSLLTSTEREILRLMALGKSTKDIASIRFSSVYTVMTHRKNIFRKLSVNNVHEATKYAMRAGIVDPMEYYI